MAKITSDMAICAYKIVNDVFNNKLLVQKEKQK